MKNKEQQTNGLLTKKDIDKAAWSYIFFAQATQNFERMMGLALLSCDGTNLKEDL